MPRFELDVIPLRHITADGIGPPGRRVFYLQGWREGETKPISILIEKIQLQSLAIGIEQMLAEVARQFPHLPEAQADFNEQEMHIQPPVDTLFRAGALGLGYEPQHDLVVILAREITAEGEGPDQAAAVRFWCTRTQARRLARWGLEVVQRGRQICPQCGEAMEPEGHFCPKKNGHKH